MAGRGARGLLLVLVLLTGCSQRDQLQPKQSNVWLVSERREIAIGEEVAIAVEKEYPVYKDAELAAYVDQIGQTLARNSDRPNIKYRFKVLDSPIANAFATPGGNIYITRGMIGVLDDEAELAGVIGHEIGHVAARHSAKQIQNSTLASIGFVALAVFAGEKMGNDMLRAADYATTLIFLGYSRGDEDQADILGAKYLYRTGYDPMGMVGAMEGLLELEKRNPAKAEEFFRTHPLTRERVTHIRAWIPRIPREDVWGGVPPLTNLRGAETFQRIAAPHAQYQGGDEMQSIIENFRVAMHRRQLALAEKCIADTYKDDKGRNKTQFLEDLRALFERSKSVTYKIDKLDTEPRRDGGAAKYDYILQIKDAATGKLLEERGRAYLEFKKWDPHIWKIVSMRTVTS